MSATLLEIVVTLVIVALIVAMFARPAGLLPVVLAFGIVVVAVIVTWNQIETYRTQKASPPAEPQAQAGAAAPAQSPPGSGS